MNTTSSKRRHFGRSWSTLTALIVAVLAVLMLGTASPASADAVGYSTGGGQISMWTNCNTNSYASPTPADITVAANVLPERSRTSQRIFVQFWFYRVATGTWQYINAGSQWVTIDTNGAVSRATYTPAYHGTYKVVTRVYYQQPDGSTPYWDLNETIYKNVWNGLPVSYTSGSCTI
jgi:hypothetical protein